MTSEDAFYWFLPVAMLAFIVFQLRHGRVVVGTWTTLDKSDDEGRFWLFIVAECLVLLILIGQAAGR